MKTTIKLVISTVFVAPVIAALACGPDFPNAFLNMGSRFLLRAPFALFSKELEDQVSPSPHSAVPLESSQTHRMQTLDAEMSDLELALQKSGVSEAERALIIGRYALERNKFQKSNSEEISDITVPENVPVEFQKYLEAAARYHRDEFEEAEAVWLELLQLPAEERPFRSVWAAYMIGRIHVDQNADRAIEYMQMTRELAYEGFTDSLGLAAASYGWEAKAHLENDDLVNAALRYLDQHATGDVTAYDSLRIVYNRIARSSDAVLESIAGQPEVSKLYTSHLISVRSRHYQNDGIDPFERWLTVLESIGADEFELAPQCALIAYRSGQMEATRRWLSRTPEKSLLGQWLEAKLALRDGDVEVAAEIYSAIIPYITNTEVERKGELENYSLALITGEMSPPIALVSAPSVVFAEKGVLHLSQREYVHALDALLQSQFWYDAAYVAERILTTEELREYVDLNWSGSEGPEERFDNTYLRTQNKLTNPGSIIRYLLARRLMREGRSDEAHGYFPTSLRGVHEEFRRWFEKGNDTNLSDEERSEALWEAAKIYRQQGLELFGTELRPDYRVNGGGYTYGVSEDARYRLPLWEFAGPTLDEYQRVQATVAEPDKRFHYRATRRLILRGRRRNSCRTTTLKPRAFSGKPEPGSKTVIPKRPIDSTKLSSIATANLQLGNVLMNCVGFLRATTRPGTLL